MKIKNTKRALLMSGLSLMLCMSMLIGSTFAWFTDSVTSAGNKIQSGTLDIDLVDASGASLEGQMIEWALPAGDTRAQDDILWEPGCTYVTEPFYIVNKGNLDLKYKFEVTGITGDAKLLEVIDFTCTNNNADFAFNTGAENVLKAGNDAKVGPFVLKGHMDEEAGNEYQGLTIEGIAITVLAAQLASESDSFNNQYDASAKYGYYSDSEPVVAGAAGYSFELRDENGTKVASADVPGEAVSENASKIEVIVKDSSYASNMTVATDKTKKSFDVTVLGLKENNTTPVKVQLRIEAGLDPATVVLYHYDQVIPSTYDPVTGYVSFETATFSPFTVAYDEDSEYVAPEIPEGATIPRATVTYAAEHVGKDKITWGSYNGIAPTEGLEANLEAAFVFECPEESDPAYNDWYCDFYVSLDRDLGENQIFLGGNYGGFGWVGFHNGDITLAANEEIPLLGSIVTNGWTYAAIRDFVGTFTCGVGDVNDALDGATFTVNLRLTNPEDETESYDVNEVTYTFGGDSVIDGTTVVTTGEPMYGTPDGSIIFDWSLMGKGHTSPNSGHTDTSPEFTIAGHMKEEAGNVYQGLKIEGVSITALAKQEVYEYDSFGREYDRQSTFLNDLAPSTSLTKDESGNWLITSSNDLVYLAQQVNSGVSYVGETILLANDINLKNAEWTPIGTKAKGFSGTFDGQNHTISNYQVNEEEYAGLFGYALNGGNIKNLTVANATVKATDRAGALLGAGYTDVVNCHAIDCEVTVTPALQDNGEYDGGAKAGAVVGQLFEGSGMSIVNCTAKNVKVSGYRDIGAVLGMAHDNNTVTDCKAYDSNNGNGSTTVITGCTFTNIDGEAIGYVASSLPATFESDVINNNTGLTAENVIGY